MVPSVVPRKSETQLKAGRLLALTNILEYTMKCHYQQDIVFIDVSRNSYTFSQVQTV